MDEDVQRELQANIARRLTPQPVKIRADVEVTCYNAAGIDAIRAALQAAEDIQTEEIPIKVKLVAPPLYVLITNSTDKTGGIELLEQALVRIDESIKQAGGNLTVKMKVSGAERVPARSCPLTRCIARSQRPCPSRRTRSWSSSWHVWRRRMHRSRATSK